MQCLNLISDQGAQQLQDYYQKVLTENNATPLDYYQAHFTLGLLAWRGGNLRTLHHNLAAAANNAVDIISLRDLNNTTAERIPHSIALAFLVILNFGSEACIKRLATLPRKQWFQPETDTYKPLADLLDILRNYTTHKKLNEKELHALIQANNNPTADLFYQPWVAALGQGLLAIAQHNATKTQQQLTHLLEQHQHIALEGSWKNTVEGLLSFWALTLVNIAKHEDIKLTINSRYLPKS